MHVVRNVLQISDTAGVVMAGILGLVVSLGVGVAILKAFLRV